MATVSLGATSFSGVTLSPSSTSSTTQTTTTTKTPEEQFKDLQQQFIKGNISGEDFAKQAKELGYNVTVNTNAIQLPKVADLQAQRTELVRLLNIAKKAGNTTMGQIYNQQIDQIDQMISIVNSKATTASKKAQIAKLIGFDGTPVSPTDILGANIITLNAQIAFTDSSACTSSPATKSRVKGYLTNLKNEYQKALDKIKNSNLSTSEIESLFASLETKSNSISNNSMVKSVLKEMPDKIANGEFEKAEEKTRAPLDTEKVPDWAKNLPKWLQRMVNDKGEGSYRDLLLLIGGYALCTFIPGAALVGGVFTGLSGLAIAGAILQD